MRYGAWERAEPRRRGPKGYRRADNRLLDDIAERLMYRDDIDSSDISVEVSNSKVTLAGTVPERWMRYAVDDIAESVMGVEEVENRVRVRRTGDESVARTHDMGGERGH